MSLDHDWRFAELVARTFTDPALRERYLADPRTVLAEAGVELAAGSPAPALPAAEDLDIVVGSFGTGDDHVLPVTADSGTGTFFCLCLVDDPQEPPVAAVPETRAA